MLLDTSRKKRYEVGYQWERTWIKSNNNSGYKWNLHNRFISESYEMEVSKKKSCILWIAWLTLVLNTAWIYVNLLSSYDIVWKLQQAKNVSKITKN